VANLSRCSARGISPRGWCIRRCTRRCSHHARSCLPVAVGRLAEGGFITSVANRNLRAMSFYRKEKARNVRAFCLVYFTLFLSFLRRLTSCRSFSPILSNSVVLFSSSFSDHLSSTAFSISETKIPLLCSTPIEWSFLPIISQNRKVRLLSEPSMVRFYYFRSLLTISNEEIILFSSISIIHN